MINSIEVGKVKSMNPHKFAMWLFLVSVIMVFVSLSSAYIVKKAFGDWIYIEFPSLFQFTTGIILFSSVPMQFAYISAKKNNLNNVRIGLVITAILALIFIFGQLNACTQLVDRGHYFVGNPAGSFIYIFTGLHIVHLIGAILFLLIVLRKAFKHQDHSKKMIQIEMCATFWHFLGGLWLYLYLFLTFNN